MGRGLTCWCWTDISGSDSTSGCSFFFLTHMTALVIHLMVLMARKSDRTRCVYGHTNHVVFCLRDVSNCCLIVELKQTCIYRHIPTIIFEFFPSSIVCIHFLPQFLTVCIDVWWSLHLFSSEPFLCWQLHIFNNSNHVLISVIK
jgi:hypothetical protein